MSRAILDGRPAMKTLALALLPLIFVAGGAQETQEAEKPQETTPPKRSTDPVTRFFQGEGERLAEEIEGSWMLVDFVDPRQHPLTDAADGFATFHDGFLTLIVSIRTLNQRWLNLEEELLLQTGAYRYRFDEQTNLQLSTVLGYTSFTEGAVLVRERSGEAYEYITTIADGVLELRTVDGVVISFRRTAAGEFPDSAIRTLEGDRSGQEFWEEMTNQPR
jgi:hypothetical protein